MFQFAFRIVVSSILIFAAVSKLQVAPAILRGESLLSNPLLLYAAICVESGVSIWALIAPSRLAWPIITILFATLTIFASWAIVTNRECSCFGDLLPSGTSLPINIGIVVAMMLTRRKWGIGQRDILYSSEPTESPASDLGRDKWATQFAGACFASLAAASVSVFVLHLAIKTQREVPNIRFLLADDWIGKSWPIDDQFDASLSELKKGKWLALIFRSDCEHCKTLAKRIEETQNVNADGKPNIVSFVAGSTVWPVHFGKASTNSESSTRIQWNGREEPFVASPAAFLIDDGKVTEAKDGQKADDFVARILDLQTK